MWKRRPKSDEDFDTEKAQAIVRIIIVSFANLYVLPQIYAGTVPLEAGSVAYLVIYYWFFSFGAYWWVVQRPADNVLRRAITITNDIGALTYTMAMGGAPFLPLYSIVIWVTVGNGLRFGTTYLKISTAAALASIAVTTYVNDYWRANPFMVLTLVSTTILVPAYIFILLGRVERAYQREQEASLSKSRFLAQASHDLRQPIHAISLFTACLRDANLPNRELQMVDNIDRSLQSVSRLFKSLLDISTLDSGKVEPVVEPVQIEEIIEDVVRQNSEAAQIDGTELRAIPCDVTVMTDRALFTTMLQNIVNNAIKYAPGRPILIACRRRGGTLAVQVYDRGPGIPYEHQDKVFDEFHQVRERGDKDVEGVGLGLPIVRRLSRLLGLDVELRSVPERGTCVTLSDLSIARNFVGVTGKPMVDQPVAIDGVKVLLVEDDEAVLAATASLLRKWGCQVQAEAAIPSTVAHIDLLITDFDLGNGMTGTECIDRVRQLAGREIPVVVMSGHDEARVREDLGSPEIPILSKPVRPAELRSVILSGAIRMRAGSTAI